MRSAGTQFDEFKLRALEQGPELAIEFWRIESAGPAGVAIRQFTDPYFLAVGIQINPDRRQILG